MRRSLEEAGYQVDVARDRGGTQLMLHRQEVSQELDGHAIGQQRGPPDLLTEQLWCAALGEEHGDRTPAALLLGLTGTGV